MKGETNRLGAPLRVEVERPRRQDMTTRNGPATMAMNRIAPAHAGRGLRAGVEEITPEMAEMYLATNPINFRRLMPRRVALLAAMIAEGRWQLNGVPIIFDQNDRLIDGQHRLAACVRSGVPITALVVWGSTSDEFIDSNIATRSLAQRAANAGLKNAGTVSAIARMYYTYSRGARTIGEYTGKGQEFLADKFQREMDSHGAAYEFAAVAAETVRRRAHVPCTGMIVFLCAISGRPAAEATAERFRVGLADGIGLVPGDPCLYLRERSMSSLSPRESRERIPAFEHAVLTAKAWNATVKREPMFRAAGRGKFTKIPTLPEIVIP